MSQSRAYIVQGLESACWAAPQLKRRPLCCPVLSPQALRHRPPCVRHRRSQRPLQAGSQGEAPSPLQAPPPQLLGACRAQGSQSGKSGQTLGAPRCHNSCSCQLCAWCGRMVAGPWCGEACGWKDRRAGCGTEGASAWSTHQCPCWAQLPPLTPTTSPPAPGPPQPVGDPRGPPLPHPLPSARPPSLPQLPGELLLRAAAAMLTVRLLKW